MIEKATVLSTNGNKAIVVVQRTTACASCGQCMIGKENLKVEAEVENHINAQIGDVVDVELELSRVLSASMIAYGIPFAPFFIGCVLGYYVLNHFITINRDFLAILTGVILIAASYLGIRRMDKKGLFKQRFSIKMIK